MERWISIGSGERSVDGRVRSECWVSRGGVDRRRKSKASGQNGQSKNQQEEHEHEDTKPTKKKRKKNPCENFSQKKEKTWRKLSHLQIAKHVVREELHNVEQRVRLRYAVLCVRVFVFVYIWIKFFGEGDWLGRWDFAIWEYDCDRCFCFVVMLIFHIACWYWCEFFAFRISVYGYEIIRKGMGIEFFEFWFRIFDFESSSNRGSMNIAMDINININK